MTRIPAAASEDRNAYQLAFIHRLKTVVGMIFGTDERSGSGAPWLENPNAITPLLYAPPTQILAADVAFELQIEPLDAAVYFMQYASYLELGEILLVQPSGDSKRSENDMSTFSRHRRIVSHLRELKKQRWDDQTCEHYADVLAKRMDEKET